MNNPNNPQRRTQIHVLSGDVYSVQSSEASTRSGNMHDHHVISHGTSSCCDESIEVTAILADEQQGGSQFVPRDQQDHDSLFDGLDMNRNEPGDPLELRLARQQHIEHYYSDEVQVQVQSEVPTQELLQRHLTYHSTPARMLISAKNNGNYYSPSSITSAATRSDLGFISRGSKGGGCAEHKSARCVVNNGVDQQQKKNNDGVGTSQSLFTNILQWNTAGDSSVNNDMRPKAVNSAADDDKEAEFREEDMALWRELYGQSDDSNFLQAKQMHSNNVIEPEISFGVYPTQDVDGSHAVSAVGHNLDPVTHQLKLLKSQFKGEIKAVKKGAANAMNYLQETMVQAFYVDPLASNGDDDDEDEIIADLNKSYGDHTHVTPKQSNRKSVRYGGLSRIDIDLGTSDDSSDILLVSSNPAILLYYHSLQKCLSIPVELWIEAGIVAEDTRKVTPPEIVWRTSPDFACSSSGSGLNESPKSVIDIGQTQSSLQVHKVSLLHIRSIKSFNQSMHTDIIGDFMIDMSELIDRALVVTTSDGEIGLFVARNNSEKCRIIQRLSSEVAQFVNCLVTGDELECSRFFAGGVKDIPLVLDYCRNILFTDSQTTN